MEFNLEEELKKLPARPGVYLMHAADDEIIYVGKAVRLCSRVRQYFQNSRKPGEKIARMVSNIAWFEYIVTDSEVEALVLECNLIKLHRPKYNTMLMDDKAYPYIRVTVEEDFPRVLLARKRARDHSRYFGPYPSGTSVREILDLIHRLYGIRTCSRSLPKEIGKERPCLNYHIKQCPGPCTGNISAEEYAVHVQSVLDLLGGGFSKLRRELEEKMKDAASRMEFEEAARYRDLAARVKAIAQTQKITDSNSLDDRDLIACAVEDSDAVVQVFFVREGKLIGREHFHVSVAEGDAEADILTNFVKQYYAGTPFLPGEIYVKHPLEDSGAIENWLTARRGKKVEIRVPQRGNKEKLLELAASNAAMVLKQDRDRILREEQRTTGALNEIAGWLGLEQIRRMEAYDISNTSGLESVGSMVVFEDGKPKRNDYRKFRIRTVQGPNDYASMYEVLTRRFERGIREEKEQIEDSFTRMPDLLMMDGGKGQVNMALQVLDELGLSIPVCGMVKDDRHMTRGLYYNNEELPIDTHSEGFHLITRIQDEAHRFAITFHKNLRSKKQVHSILDDIPGIGEKRRHALMRAFGDIYAIRNAAEEELAAADGMNRRAAEAVFSFFHSDDSKAVQSSEEGGTR